MKVWRNPEWYFDPGRGGWCLTKAGEYESGDMPDIDKTIDMREVQQLIVALDEEGWIKPRLDERLRTEDLRITHRLMDIIEKKLPGG
uniref:Uncharacterized protein n=1 Tax=viral metagenome TaxID=1070528 RepID=A0A6M3J9I5_9ZZZZ